MKREVGVVYVLGFLVVFISSVIGGEEVADLAEKCSNDFQKVIGCLDYATGKAATPSTECCDSVKDIKDGKPVCLCFFIQQTHSGSQQIKALGIQEGKLLQLPSACNLKNSNVSYCPKLLGISPNSPDAAIFNNSSLPTTPVSSTTLQSGTSGIKITPHYGVALMAIVIAIFFTTFTASPLTCHA